jgi:hypothetical protein
MALETWPWYGLLWRISQLDLQLIPTDPDRAAGLGFVGDAQRFFWIILVDLSATTAGVLGNEIVFGRVPLTRYTIAIAGYMVCSVFMAATRSFAPDPHRETTWIACVKETSRGCTRSRLRI